jgi:hypothetical protein
MFIFRSKFREIEHQVKDNNGKPTDSDEFLDNPLTQTLPKCNCARPSEEINEKSEKND